MAAKASDLFVECLEAEGVRHIFGIPGEETRDLNALALDVPSIIVVPIDDTLDLAMFDELGEEIVPT